VFYEGSIFNHHKTVLGSFFKKRDKRAYTLPLQWRFVASDADQNDENSLFFTNPRFREVAPWLQRVCEFQNSGKMYYWTFGMKPAI
jgi:hypothetical protein